jgi:hypothetical protein
MNQQFLENYIFSSSLSNYEKHTEKTIQLISNQTISLVEYLLVKDSFTEKNPRLIIKDVLQHIGNANYYNPKRKHCAGISTLNHFDIGFQNIESNSRNYFLRQDRESLIQKKLYNKTSNWV